LDGLYSNSSFSSIIGTQAELRKRTAVSIKACKKWSLLVSR
jgi:hypothetical protein